MFFFFPPYTDLIPYCRQIRNAVKTRSADGYDQMMSDYASGRQNSAYNQPRGQSGTKHVGLFTNMTCAADCI